MSRRLAPGKWLTAMLREVVAYVVLLGLIAFVLFAVAMGRALR